MVSPGSSKAGECRSHRARCCRLWIVKRSKLNSVVLPAPDGQPPPPFAWRNIKGSRHPAPRDLAAMDSETSHPAMRNAAPPSAGRSIATGFAGRTMPVLSASSSSRRSVAPRVGLHPAFLPMRPLTPATMAEYKMNCASSRRHVALHHCVRPNQGRTIAPNTSRMATTVSKARAQMRRMAVTNARSTVRQSAAASIFSCVKACTTLTIQHFPGHGRRINNAVLRIARVSTRRPKNMISAITANKVTIAMAESLGLVTNIMTTRRRTQACCAAPSELVPTTVCTSVVSVVKREHFAGFGCFKTPGFVQPRACTPPRKSAVTLTQPGHRVEAVAVAAANRTPHRRGQEIKIDLRRALFTRSAETGSIICLNAGGRASVARRPTTTPHRRMRNASDKV